MSASRPVTLKALAQELGLNASTVSRVLNDPARMGSRWASPETAERIFALALLRGYTRNPYAASLRTDRSNTIGVIVPHFADYVFAGIYEGIDEAATENACQTMVSNSFDEEALRRTKVERLLASRVDGLIFGDARSDQRELFDELSERRIPHVLVSRKLSGHVSVTCDDVVGGRLAAEHLLAAGRESFAIIAGHPATSTASLRRSGFLEVLREHGIATDRVRVLHGGIDAVAGRQAAEALLTSGPAPQAIFATNDFAAIGVMGALHAHGVAVGQDIALCGYNDTPLAESLGLTSVRLPMHQMGYRGYELLAELVQGRKAQSEDLAPELIVRVSTQASD